MHIFLYAPQDFHNICTISRNLESFGIQECHIFDPHHLIRERYGKSYSRKIRSISAGAFEKIRFIKVDDPITFLIQYQGRKIATLLDEASESLHDFSFEKNDLLVF